MRIKRSNIIVMLAAIVLIVLGIYRYIIINKDMPKEYLIDNYSLGESITLDQVQIKVKSFEKLRRNLEEHGDENLGCILEVNIKNISGEVVDIAPIIENSRLGFGTSYQDYADATGDLKKVKNLQPNEEANLTLNYVIFEDALKKSKNLNEFDFYISKELYKNQVEKEINELKLYAKVITLRGE